MATLEFSNNKLLAKNQGFGAVFGRHNSTDYFLRVKPVQYILNSTLIVSKINAGGILVVNLNKSTCHFIDGNEIVIPIQSATMSIEK